MISIIIPVRNKKSIIKVLQRVNELILDFNIEIIVIISYDGNKSEDLELIKNQRNTLIVSKIILVSQDHFNKATLLNIGIGEATFEYILNLDADVLLDKLTLKIWSQYINENTIITPKFIQESDDGSLRTAPGIVLAPKRKILKIKGLSEDFKGWGFEDHDYLRRLRSVCNNFYKIGILIHLSHSDIVRTINYEVTSKKYSREQNLKTLKMRILQDERMGSLSESCSYDKNILNDIS